ncbi:anthranilate synthase component I family protein [Microbacterium dextranolyticum]|uniref:Chorismate-utilising enzyme C-terminal domain-containing protein n=1 Tax=Microbacterium dextranolyticum TaxID=36806 RepID=A0A9W6HNC8_9MICO|nr:anthranilate synthase component I family protein [Microbacterium dextranolyticum]MBM7462882.1 anthranilate synthase component 1 [Microbacterium dextranolyticum]GLJ96012.1 hypothetical protein GCM10017591_20750 [Microbacterium dextranolyticum]
MQARPTAVRIDWIDPADLFRAGPAHESNAFWLDAGPDAAEGWSWMGVGAAASRAPRDLALAGRSAELGGGDDGVPGGFAGGWVGWIGYDGGTGAVGAPAQMDADAPDEAGIDARSLIAFDHMRREAWIIAPEADLADARREVDRWRQQAGDQPPFRDLDATDIRVSSARHTPAVYAALIARCREAIRAGDAYQLCLTTRFEVARDEPIDPVEAYLRLRRALPAHHGGWVRVGEHALLSSSPERFLRVAQGVVRTHPIKGTRPRSHDPVPDAAAAAALVASEKERAENVMIVDLMRNDLQRVCEPGSVAAERLLEVESYSAVHQLVSTVAGRLRPGCTVGDLLDATFPAGSMTGAPKRSAMTILHDLESAPRGVYAGCFGWIGSDGALDLAMTIRSIVVHPRGAYVGAGGGITWLSEAEDELAEVAVKARGPLAALGAALPAGWAGLRGADASAAVESALPPVR